jgi:hypothetical protein
MAHEKHCSGASRGVERTGNSAAIFFVKTTRVDDKGEGNLTLSCL